MRLAQLRPSLLRYHSPGRLLRFGVGRMLRAAFAGPIAAVTPPDLPELTAGAVVTTSARDTLAEVAAASPSELDGYADEFDHLVTALLARVTSVGRRFPSQWEIERETGALLYSLVRSVRPDMVLETGVADGVSSYVLLAALEANGSGRLTSIDIAPNVGGLVPDEVRGRWDLRIIDSSQSESQLTSALDEIGPLDIYFHDSSHNYLKQLFEYAAVWPHLRYGGWLLSDDINYSRAWNEFTRRQGLASTIMLDRRKAFGVAMRPPAN